MQRTPCRIHGFSLVELMIASTIGLLLLSGLAMIFVNTSDANRELQKTAQQIENGRYGIEIISQDLRHAGFYGHVHNLALAQVPAQAVIPPDPCEDSDKDILRSAMWFPVQGYRGTIDAASAAADVLPTGIPASCGAYLNAANLVPGSDVLVIRRANTFALDRAPAGTTATRTARRDWIYLQASATNAIVQIPSADTELLATNNNAENTLVPVMNMINGVAAPIRRYHVHIYFVAPCSVGAGANGVCNGGAGEDRIPTLKRLELTGKDLVSIVPLVEGIEYLKIEYGTDTLPLVVNITTGFAGDGAVDGFAPTPADFRSVIAAKLYLLARNTEGTRGYADNKTYLLGTSGTPNATTPARNDTFKRHVYNSVVQLTNPAGRRLIP